MSIQSLLFPTRDLCYFCKDRTGHILGYICFECRERLNFVSKEVAMDSDFVDRAIYSLGYNKYLKEMVHAFKFNSKSYLYKPLAELMLITIKELNLNKIDIIAYIPIHRRKEAIRGYNQSELLAMYISQSLDIPLSKRNLIKKRWTREQNTLDRIERLKNLKDSFKIRNPQEFNGKRVLLIDDIITTGSTFNEAARLIKECGATNVVCLALTSSKSI